MKPIPDAFTDYSLGDNGNSFPPKSMIRLITCHRDHTRGNVYNYSMWRCGRCDWYPGEAEGPPNIRCQNCGNHHYTDDPEEATALILIVRDRIGYGFKFLAQFRLNRNSWEPWFETMNTKYSSRVLSSCVGEMK